MFLRVCTDSATYTEYLDNKAGLWYIFENPTRTANSLRLYGENEIGRTKDARNVTLKVFN